MVISKFGTEYHHPDTGDARAGMSSRLLPQRRSATSHGSLTLRATLEGSIDNAIERAGINGDTLLLSEFGATDDPSDQAHGRARRPPHGLLAVVALLRLRGPDDGRRAGDQQAIVSAPRRPPVGANVFTDKLALMERPYPQIVAGTPTGWSSTPPRRL